jgi:chaperonin GroEL
LNATRAAVEEGIVPGGGTALLKSEKALRAFVETLKHDERTGGEILTRALEAPCRQIADNAGDRGHVVVDKVKHEAGNIGYDALNGVYADMFQIGVVDPVKVTRSALENAASIAGLLLTTEALIVDIPEKKAPAMPGGMPGMDDY